MRVITRARLRRLGLGAACTLAGAAIGSAAMAYQGHMYAALKDLEAAQQQLSVAVADKGGHRAAAQSLVAQAISEVNAGIAYAK